MRRDNECAGKCGAARKTENVRRKWPMERTTDRAEGGYIRQI
ncbi:hypothetical protein CK3_08770 [butyrate-producing bacterium SS3/4]|nr:hypothetical protein CK3_08770 [butyrate-producing bacterium SS3/4]